jgi:arsenite-transporting ATPase
VPRDSNDPAARIILFTGKGGVGKTSAAAATAVRVAATGRGVLVMSTDAAHSLSDSFDQAIGHQPTPIADRLWGQEVDVNQQISKNWGPIHDFFHRFLESRGFDAVVSDELAVFPGMEEIFSLLEVKDHAADPRFDVVIIDCAPTADTARLLAVPDIFRWYMEKIFNIERVVFKTVRPVAKHLVEMPLPTDDVFDAVQKLYVQLAAVKKRLIDRDKTSIRMVVNAEKMVINEARRAFTFLSLFDFGVDAVVVNRLLPPEITDPYYGKWRDIQKKHLETIHQSFAPLPILSAKLWNREIIGADLLDQLGAEIYQDRDPAALLHREPPITIAPADDGRLILTLPAPFAERGELETWIHGEELTIKYKNFKRNLILPRTLVRRELIRAEMRDGMLRLTFGGTDDRGDDS